MNTEKWKIIEDFVLNDEHFDSDDFEEFCEVININKKVIDIKIQNIEEKIEWLERNIEKLYFRCTYENCELNKDKTNIPFKDLKRDVMGDHLDFICPKCGRVIICGMGYLEIKDQRRTNES